MQWILSLALGCGGPPQEAPAPEAPAGPLITQLALGGSASCALVSDGTVRCWGGNLQGQVGAQDTGAWFPSPRVVEGLEGVTGLFGGASAARGFAREDTFCATREGGPPVCWGADGGAFGLASRGRGGPERAETPHLVGARGLAFNNGNGCLLDAAGAVQCWGGDRAGELGDGDEASSSRAPRAAAGLAGVTDLAGGGARFGALLGDGTARCWGTRCPDRYPDAVTARDVAAPAAIEGLAGAAALAMTDDTTCVIEGDRVVCWGLSLGQRERWAPIDGTEGAGALAAGRDFVCALRGGGAACLGMNRWGQLGRGYIDRVWTSTAQPVSGLAGASAIAAGSEHACAVVDGGRGVMCWGRNDHGQRGDGTLEDRAAPGAGGHLFAPAPPSPPPTQRGDAPPPLVGAPEACAPTAITLGGEAAAVDLSPQTVIASAAGTRTSFALKLLVLGAPGEPVDAWKPPRGDQARLSAVVMSRGVGLAEGRYTSDEEDHSFLLSVSTRAQSWRLSGVKAEVALDYIGPVWICGRMKLAGRRSSAEGPFAARVVDASWGPP